MVLLIQIWAVVLKKQRSAVCCQREEEIDLRRRAVSDIRSKGRGFQVGFPDLSDEVIVCRHIQNSCFFIPLNLSKQKIKPIGIDMGAKEMGSKANLRFYNRKNRPQQQRIFVCR